MPHSSNDKNFCQSRMLLLAVMTMLLTASTSAFLNRKFSFIAEGYKGSSSIKDVFAHTEPLCSIYCAHVSTCLGYNWIADQNLCQFLGSLELTTISMDPSSILTAAWDAKYIPTAIQSCSACVGASPPAGNTEDWTNRCDTNGLGFIAGLDISMYQNNLNKLVCSEMTNLVFDPVEGIALNGSENGCVAAMGKPAAVVAVWSDEENFESADNFAFQCRPIISGHKVDTSNCLEPNITYDYKDKTSFPSKNHLGIICPPDMIVNNLFRLLRNEFRVTCCSFYFNSEAFVTTA